MATDRRADVTWKGSLDGGQRHDREDDERRDRRAARVSWAARSEDATGGKTSPEELIAAAHAACFSMALSAGLAKAGTPPDELQDLGDGHVPAGRGDHEDRADRRGQRARHRRRGVRGGRADGAKANCPVSKALAGVPEITLDARLR